MKKKIEYKYDPEYNYSEVVINYKGESFFGTAICHDNDAEFANERTGLTIAEDRATIEYLRFVRDYEIKPKLASLPKFQSLTIAPVANMLSPTNSP